MNRTWTQEMEDQVYLLSKQKLSMTEIAKILNQAFGTTLTKNAVISKLSKLYNNKVKKRTAHTLRHDETVLEYSRRVGNNKWTKEMKQRLIELNADNFRTTQIVKKLNGEFNTDLSAGSVSAMCSNLGLEKPVSLAKLNQLPFKKIMSAPLKTEQPSEFKHKLLDLKNSQCHYTDDGSHFCGDPAVSGKSYCKKHLKLCHAGRTETTEQRKGY